MVTDSEQRLHWRDLKRSARQSLRSNVVACVAVSVLGGVFIWPILTLSTIVTASYDFLLAFFEFMDWPLAADSLRNAQFWWLDVEQLTSVGSHSSQGVISNVYNTIENAGGIEKALLYAISHAVFAGGISATIIATAAGILSLVIFFLVRVPLRISTQRFYLETHSYRDTEVARLLYIFKRRRTLAMARASVYKYFRLFLWAFTIIGLPMKYYSYLLYDFIMAENPDASPIEVLRLSETLMRGKRTRAFLLDLSFLGWYALSLVSFGLAMYFYATPYRSLALTELYLRIRADALEAKVPGAEICNDVLLATPPAGQDPADGQLPLISIYPLTHTGFPSRATRMDYRRDYSLVNLVLLFFCFSFIGWVWESTMSLAYEGHFVNRGTMWGPWLPIYGCGGVVALVALKKLRDHPFLSFCAAVVLCGIIEYFTATVIYDTSGLEYWSYTGYFFNIDGRVCLEGLLVFGMGCSAAIYFIAPLFDTLLNRIPLTLRYWIVGVLLAAFAVDCAMVMMFPRTGAGITET